MPAEKLAERLVAARATQQQSADEIYARAVSGAQDTSPSESQRIAEAGWPRSDSADDSQSLQMHTCPPLGPCRILLINDCVVAR